MTTPTLSLAEPDDPTRDRAGRRLGVAIVGSVVLHLGVLALGLLSGSSRTAMVPARELRPLQLVMVDTADDRFVATSRSASTSTGDGSAASDASDGAAAPGGDPTGGGPGTSIADPQALDPNALAELDPSALDPQALADLDLDALADLDLEGLDLDAFTELELAAMDLPPELLARLRRSDRRPAPAAPSPAATGADAALGELTTAPPARADAAAPAPDAPDAAPSSDPAALTVADDPRDEADRTPLDAPDNEVEPEPVAEPEEEPEDDPDWLAYLRADDDAPAIASKEEVEVISSKDSVAEEARRTPVTASAPGRRTQVTEGTPVRTGTPTFVQLEGDEVGDLGDRPVAGIQEPARKAATLGGGRRSDDRGLGAPERGGHQQGGALARSGRTAAASASMVVLPGGGGAAGARGPSPAPDGTEPAPSPQSDWWQPSVARIVVVAPQAPPTVAVVTAPLPTEAHAVAPVPRPERRSSRGGTERTDDIDEKAPEQTREHELPDAGEAEEIIKEKEHIETFADLRADMGWGGIARTEAPPRRTDPGVESDDGQLPTSPQVSDAQLPIDHVVFVTATDTPLGRYRAQLDEEIQTLWLGSDISLEERAQGIQGDTTIQFRVLANGRVEDKAILRSSGHTSLDGLAFDAIPRRLLRIPREVGEDVVFHRYTFRYRNPIIVD